MQQAQIKTSLTPQADTLKVVVPEHGSLYTDNKHDFFFIRNAHLYEKLKSGKIRHRLKLEYKNPIDKEKDIPCLTPEQVKDIEKRYL